MTIPTPDPRADLAGRLRQALTAEDAEHAVEIVVGAGWRPDTLPPLAELVTDEDVFAARKAYRSDEDEGRRGPMRAALECYETSAKRVAAGHGCVPTDCRTVLPRSDLGLTPCPVASGTPPCERAAVP